MVTIGHLGTTPSKRLLCTPTGTHWIRVHRRFQDGNIGLTGIAPNAKYIYPSIYLFMMMASRLAAVAGLLPSDDQALFFLVNTSC